MKELAVEVTALVRDDSKITPLRCRPPRRGDACGADGVAETLVGSDAVISTRGSMKASDVLVTAATAAKVKRFVWSCGASSPPHSSSAT